MCIRPAMQKFIQILIVAHHKIQGQASQNAGKISVKNFFTFPKAFVKFVLKKKSFYGDRFARIPRLVGVATLGSGNKIAIQLRGKDGQNRIKYFIRPRQRYQGVRYGTQTFFPRKRRQRHNDSPSCLTSSKDETVFSISSSCVAMATTSTFSSIKASVPCFSSPAAYASEWI
jgi:hypothetical protein